MHHVAIMNKSWRLIPKILSGAKTIESRWYQTRRAPWNKIRRSDLVWFKNSGEPVTARATVSEVLQFEIGEVRDIEAILKKYGDAIQLVNRNPRSWKRIPKYCVLIRLSNPKEVEPFGINKKGFGISSAWLVVPNIRDIRSDNI